jgi:hypothetical protein
MNKRHRRAGAERRDDAQRRGHHVGQAFASLSMTAGQQGTGALGGEVGVHHAHHEHHRGEQQQDLGRVVEEELQRAAQVTLPIDGQDCDQGLRGRRQRTVERPPQQGRDNEEGARMLARQALGALGQGQGRHGKASPP